MGGAEKVAEAISRGLKEIAEAHQAGLLAIAEAIKERKGP